MATFRKGEMIATEIEVEVTVFDEGPLRLECEGLYSADIPMAESKLVTILNERVTNHIRFFWAAIAVGCAWLAFISVALYNINGQLGLLRIPQKLGSSAENPKDRKSQIEALALLDKAETTQTPIPEPVVRRSGLRFSEAAATQDSAWRVAIRLAAYRTSFNNAPDPGPLIPAGQDKAFAQAFRGSVGEHSQEVEDELSRIFFSVLRVPKADGADAGDLKVHESFFRCCYKDVPKWIVVEGAPGREFSLDYFLGRNVIFKSMRIAYDGAPLDLAGVYFVACSLNGKNVPNGRALANVLLAMNPVSIETY